MTVKAEINKYFMRTGNPEGQSKLGVRAKDWAGIGVRANMGFVRAGWKPALGSEHH